MQCGHLDFLRVSADSNVQLSLKTTGPSEIGFLDGKLTFVPEDPDKESTRYADM